MFWVSGSFECYYQQTELLSSCVDNWQLLPSGLGRGDTISLLHIDRLRNGWRLSSRLPSFVPNRIHNPSHAVDWVSLVQRNCEPWEGSRTPTRVIPTSPGFFLKLTELLPASGTWSLTLPRMPFLLISPCLHTFGLSGPRTNAIFLDRPSQIISSKMALPHPPKDYLPWNLFYLVAWLVYCQELPLLKAKSTWAQTLHDCSPLLPVPRPIVLSSWQTLDKCSICWVNAWLLWGMLRRTFSSKKSGGLSFQFSIHRW